MINTTINQFLTKQLPNLKIAVVGDVMGDRYVFGDVSRISPEAPVPVNRVSKMKEVLGQLHDKSEGDSDDASEDEEEGE